MADRCTGHCCRAFVLHGWTYEKIQEAYTAWREQRSGATWPNDIWLIAPMIRQNPVEAGHDPTFSCIHLQANGDCGIYNIRPQVCREYPNNRGCCFEGCTWDAQRLPAVFRDNAPCRPAVEAASVESSELLQIRSTEACR